MDRASLSAQVPDFVAIAESNIADDVRVREMLVAGTITTTPGSGLAALPTDFLEFADVSLNGLPLEYATSDRFRDNAQRWIGVPAEYYGIEGENLLVGVNSVAQTFNVTYYKRIPALAVQPTNFLLTKYPQIYLYGALSQAALFMVDDPRAATWAAIYQQAVDKANGSSRKAVSSGSPLRIRPR
ncbi:MAG: hypothetical protein EOO23_01705 [Comamonadaceae bacterium]|nr:MAG: hypothetical protein EOO23_01705 [Comamonadaceae bacterium]